MRSVVMIVVVGVQATVVRYKVKIRIVRWWWFEEKARHGYEEMTGAMATGRKWSPSLGPWLRVGALGCTLLVDISSSSPPPSTITITRK